VCCGFVIFFLPHLADSLAGFQRVLKPGGLLAVSTWGRDDERWKWMGEVFDAYLPPDAPKSPSGPSRFNNAAGMEAIMGEGGFEQIEVIEEDHEFVYANEEAWWAVQWSHGRRWLLEMLPPDALAKLKDEAFEKIQVNREADGFHQLMPTLFTLARKAM
jgi:hypothetical protein